MAPIDGAAFRRECPWCSASTPEGATHCPACGAAVAQRTSIGGLTIPGVTTVDPALKALDGQPLHIPKPSPSQGMAGGAILAAAAGGPVGLAALGGLAAIAAIEYAAANQGSGPSGPADLTAVGRPSEAALQALERIEREAKAGGATGEGSVAPPAEGDERLSEQGR